MESATKLNINNEETCIMNGKDVFNNMSFYHLLCVQM